MRRHMHAEKAACRMHLVRLFLFLFFFIAASGFVPGELSPVSPAATAYARRCGVGCQCKQQCKAIIAECIRTGGRKKACRKGIRGNCKLQGVQVCQTHTCQPYTENCVATGDTDAAAFGGRVCSNVIGDTQLSTALLCLGSLGGATCPQFDATSVGLSALLSMSFGPGDQTALPDGRIVLDNQFNNEAMTCLGGRLGTAKHVRVEVTKVCGQGQPVLGSFAASGTAPDGSACEVRGYFSLNRNF